MGVRDLYRLALELCRSGQMDVRQLETLCLEHGHQIRCTGVCGEEIVFDSVWRHSEEDIERFKLCVAEILVGKQQDDVLEYTLSCLSSGRDCLFGAFSILHTLVAKHGVFDERILQRCRAYLHLEELRQTVSRILAVFSANRVDLLVKVFGSEEIARMSLWRPQDLHPDEPCSQEAARALFLTIDQKSFKQSKRILRQLDERFFALLPLCFTAMGYVHLRELFGGFSREKSILVERSLGRDSVARLFLPLRTSVDDALFIHRDPEVRVEAFRHIVDIDEARRFLEVNQFFCSQSLLVRLAEYFSQLVRSTHERAGLEDLYSGLVASMVRSRNASRRRLGVLLMDVLVSEDVISLPECADLLFDQCHEIRETMKKHVEGVSLDEEHVIERIESHQYNDIYGASEYLRVHHSEETMRRLKEIFDERVQAFVDEGVCESPLHGLLHLFCTVGTHDVSGDVDAVYRRCFESLVDSQHEENDNAMVYWKSLRGCCLHYCNAVLGGDAGAPLDRLVQTLLHINHLGTIQVVSSHLSVIFERVDLGRKRLDGMVDLCFERAGTCRTVFRRSGGMSLLLISMMRGRPEMCGHILETLFGWIEGSANLHCLNILSRFVEDAHVGAGMFPHTTRLFAIAFGCSRSACWSVRNVGTEILSNLSARAFGRSLEHVDGCFAVYPGLRMLFCTQMEQADAENNGVLMFFILSMYRRLGMLEEREEHAVKRCLWRDGLLGLRARDIVSGTKRSMPRTSGFAIRFDADERDILCRVLILLDSEHEEERRATESYARDVLGCDGSTEHLKHCIARKICSLGCNEYVLERLREYDAATETSLNCFFKDSSANELFDLEHGSRLLVVNKNCLAKCVD